VTVSQPVQGTGPEPVGTAREEEIPDPLEGMNRVFFEFNDRLYFWFLKPLATGYRAVLPEPARVGVRNFFHNLAFPVRFANSLLQGKIEGAVNEFARFMGNTVFGLAGFLDVIPEDCALKRQEEDLGQTLGVWGLGPGIYLHWPIFGPSSVRDTFGRVGDGFLDPLNYLIPHTKYNVPTKVFDRVNDTSLRIGDYESLKDAALDPYVALRDAYFQHRRSKIAE
jgi:phospholipid-binding lipoprotein MlaA